MMISSDTYASTNPALCSLILWSFLKGFEDVNREGCELPILFIPIPLALSKSIRETFKGTNNNTGLLTWLSREPQTLLDISLRIETSKSIIKEALIFGNSNLIILCDENGLFHSSNEGLVQKRLKEFMDISGGEDLKEVFTISRRFGNWCGQLQSTNIILNIMGMSL